MDVYTNILTNTIALIRGEPCQDVLDEYLFRSAIFRTYRVCFVWNQSKEGHKYIAALTETQDFIVAMPLTVIELHKNILEIVADATNDPAVYCPGGGYVKNQGGRLIAFSASQDFGPWDHALASKAFSQIEIL